MYAHVGFGPDAVDYVAGWELQREVHARRVAGAIPDSCLLLEHAPVYTAGKRTAVSDVTPLLERHLAAALGYRAWRRIHSTAPLTSMPLAPAAAAG